MPVTNDKTLDKIIPKPYRGTISSQLCDASVYAVQNVIGPFCCHTALQAYNYFAVHYYFGSISAMLLSKFLSSDDLVQAKNITQKHD